MRFPITHPNLGRLYQEAKRRNLDYTVLSDSEFLVTSYSRPGLMHRVRLEDGYAECSCESVDKPGTHLTLPIAHLYESIYLRWQVEEANETLRIGLSILDGSISRKKLNKWMRLSQSLRVEQPEIAIPF